MTAEEKLQLQGLLTWRKGVIPLLKVLPDTLKQVERLERQMKALQALGGGGPVARAPKDPKPVRTATNEQIEEAFEKRFAEATSEEDGQWISVADIVTALKINTSTRAVGHVLSGGLGIYSTPRRLGRKMVRCYLLRSL